MDDYYSINQVAIILKVHPLTARRYIKEKMLKAVRVGGAVRIAKKDLEKFITSFVPHARREKVAVPKAVHQPFDLADPIFRLKARGSSGR